METLKKFIKESLQGNWFVVMTDLFLVCEQTKG